MTGEKTKKKKNANASWKKAPCRKRKLHRLGTIGNSHQRGGGRRKPLGHHRALNERKNSRAVGRGGTSEEVTGEQCKYGKKTKSSRERRQRLLSRSLLWMAKGRVLYPLQKSGNEKASGREKSTKEKQPGGEHSSKDRHETGQK